MEITIGQIVPHQGGTRFPIPAPLLYYARTKSNADPKPCKMLDKLVMEMTEYE